MAHTKGPWWQADGSIRAQFEGEEVQIALVSTTRWSHPDGGKTRRLQAQSNDNARLIAAAPELLAALETLLAMTVEGECNYDAQGQEWPEVVQARAAIARAKEAQ